MDAIGDIGKQMSADAQEEMENTKSFADIKSAFTKKSPTKKRSGFKMKSSPAKIYNKKGKRRKNYKY